MAVTMPNTTEVGFSNKYLNPSQKHALYMQVRVLTKALTSQISCIHRRTGGISIMCGRGKHDAAR